MKRFLLPLVLFCISVYGALPTNTTTWEVQPTNGVDTNGGCFIAGATGSDLTYPTSSPVAYTDLVAPTATTLTSAAHAFTTASPGNCLHIASGTGWTAGWYQIVSFDGTITVTVDRAIATLGSIGGTGTLGGALKTLSKLNTVMAANHQAWMKNEAVQSMGRLDINYAQTGYSSIQGYGTTRNDGIKARIKMTAADFFIVINTSSQNIVFANFDVDCNSTCNGDGVFLQGCCVTVANLAIHGLGGHTGLEVGSSRSVAINVDVTGVTGGIAPIIIHDGSCYGCVVHDGASTIEAITMSSAGGGAQGPLCDGCIIANMSATTSGFKFADAQGSYTLRNSTVELVHGDCVAIATAVDQFPVVVMNNIFSGCSGYGINHSGSTLPPGGDVFNYNAIYNTGSGARNQISVGANDITLTCDPFQNGAGGDLRLNNRSCGGGLLRGTGWPNTLYGHRTYNDVGALQHGDPKFKIGFK